MLTRIRFFAAVVIVKAPLVFGAYISYRNLIVFFAPIITAPLSPLLRGGVEFPPAPFSCTCARAAAVRTPPAALIFGLRRKLFFFMLGGGRANPSLFSLTMFCARAVTAAVAGVRSPGARAAPLRLGRPPFLMFLTISPGAAGAIIATRVNTSSPRVPPFSPRRLEVARARFRPLLGAFLRSRRFWRTAFTLIFFLKLPAAARRSARSRSVFPVAGFRRSRSIITVEPRRRTPPNPSDLSGFYSTSDSTSSTGGRADTSVLSGIRDYVDTPDFEDVADVLPGPVVPPILFPGVKPR